MIKPTVGRIVHYRMHGNSGLAEFGSDPLAAIITKIINDRSINIALFAEGGQIDSSHSQPVILLQEDDQAPPDKPFCVWPKDR